MERHQRKVYRLYSYDYSLPNAYFVTVCTRNRENLLWTDAALHQKCIEREFSINAFLSDYGRVVDDAINNISMIYSSVLVEKYTIMPNHVHLLLRIISTEKTVEKRTPTISHVIQQMKGYVTKQLGFSIWQKLFHDHIVRNEEDHKTICRYIESNPLHWSEDCFYNS